MKREIAAYCVIALGVFFFLLMLQITLPYFSFRYDVDFLLTKQSVLHVTAWRWAFYTHISTSLFVLLLGAFQFSHRLMTRYARVHRTFGKIYVMLILLLSAPSGLIMAFYANGGAWSKASFTIISVLWWYFTLMAYRRITQRNFNAHLAYMFRSYALTLSAITLRTYVLLLPHVVHMHSREMYTFVAWASWLPNLIIAEWLIRRAIRRNTFGFNPTPRSFPAA